MNLCVVFLAYLPTRRYSYHHKLIPLLLTCTNDDLAEIKTKAQLLWDKVLLYTIIIYVLIPVAAIVSLQVGSKYEQENEDDLKDKLDFTQPVEVAPILGTIMSIQKE